MTHEIHACFNNKNCCLATSYTADSTLIHLISLIAPSLFVLQGDPGLPDGKTQSAGVDGEGAAGGFEEGVLLTPHLDNQCARSIL